MSAATASRTRFSYRRRGDGTVSIFWGNRPAATLGGMLAKRFLDAAREASDDELQQLMARAAGPFKRGDERRR